MKQGKKDKEKKDSKNEEFKKKILELGESLKRSQADFVNYKKRVDEERANNIKYSGADILMQILPILDNFNRAFAHIPKNLKNDEWVGGMIHIENHFIKTLGDLGVKKIECMGMPANYMMHDVISQSKGKKDIILQEVETGYMYHDKVLRPSKVIVGDGSEK